MGAIKKIWIGYFWLAFIFLSVGGLGLLFFGQQGMKVGFCLVGVGWGLIGLFLESIVVRLKSAVRPTHEGLLRSLELPFLKRGQRPPRIVIFPDPLPYLLCSRSWLGRGTLLMSQGLIATPSHPSLEDLLQESSVRLKNRGVCFGSGCMLFILCVLKLIPKAWIPLLSSSSSVLSLSPLSAMGYSIFFSMFPNAVRVEPLCIRGPGLSRVGLVNLLRER